MTKIEWTEITWNVVTGCTKVSAGCKNCYAETIAKRFWGDRKFTDIQFHEHKLDEPLHRKKPTMYFINSMSDLFHEKISFDDIDKIFKVIKQTPQHTYQILTKRAERMREYFQNRKEFYDNVWLGVSAENQEAYNKRVPLLSEIKNVKIRWISFEPLLEEVTMDRTQSINWVVVGGESGAKRRPFNPDWARKIRDDCKCLGIPLFMKQIDKIQQIPEDLMIREYPNNLIGGSNG